MTKTESPPALVLENRAPFVIECKPAKEFGGLIEKFWSAPRSEASEPRTFEIMPDGNFDLVFAMNEFRCRLLFLGPYTKDTYVPLFNAYEYFCVRFRPGLMPRIADLKPAELIDNMIDLPKILGIHVDSLGERLHLSPDLDAKQALIEDLFRKVGPEAIVRENLSSRCAELVESCRGRIQVHELAGLVGTSIRTLERIFLAEVGLSPKQFIRLVRFQTAIGKVRNRNYRSLAELACDCGYADQSHFIKEFKQLTGRSPSRV